MTDIRVPPVQAYDADMELVGVFDAYLYLIWTERFDEIGDFELAIRRDTKVDLSEIKFLSMEESRVTMIFENTQEINNPDSGKQLVLTGRSAESLLLMRVVQEVFTVDGEVAMDAIRRIVDENFINPTDPDRAMQNWIFSEEPVVEYFDYLYKQYAIDEVYPIMRLMGVPYGIGFDLYLNDNNVFEFRVHSGVDRSHGQSENAYVTFSEDMDNLLDSSYYSGTSDYRNVTLVITDDEVDALRRFTVTRPYDGLTPSGINRRETFTDARDVQRYVGFEIDDLTDAEFETIISGRGNTDLDGRQVVHVFEGTVDLFTTFVYDEHFFIGDIVQHVYDDRTVSARLIEIIHTYTTEALTVQAGFDFDYKTGDSGS